MKTYEQLVSQLKNVYIKVPKDNPQLQDIFKQLIIANGFKLIDEFKYDYMGKIDPTYISIDPENNKVFCIVSDVYRKENKGVVISLYAACDILDQIFKVNKNYIHISDGIKVFSKNSDEIIFIGTVPVSRHKVMTALEVLDMFDIININVQKCDQTIVTINKKDLEHMSKFLDGIHEQKILASKRIAGFNFNS